MARTRPSPQRCEAVAAVFSAAAHLTPRKGRTYDEYVTAVVQRFRKGWTALEEANRG